MQCSMKNGKLVRILDMRNPRIFIRPESMIQSQWDEKSCPCSPGSIFYEKKSLTMWIKCSDKDNRWIPTRSFRII